MLWNVNVLKLQTASSMAGCLGPGNMQYREVVHLVWSVEYDNWPLSCPVNPKKHFEKVLIVNLWRTAGVSENLMLVNHSFSFSWIEITDWNCGIFCLEDYCNVGSKRTQVRSFGGGVVCLAWCLVCVRLCRETSHSRRWVLCADTLSTIHKHHISNSFVTNSGFQYFH